MVEDVTVDELLRLRFFDFVPNFGEPAVVAATEVLPRHHALTVEGRERFVEAVAISRRPPAGLLSPVRREQLGREALDLWQKVVPLVLVVGPVVRVFDDLVGRLEAFTDPVRDEFT